MKKAVFTKSAGIGLFLSVLGVAAFTVWANQPVPSTVMPTIDIDASTVSDPTPALAAESDRTPVLAFLHDPISQARQRVTKKPFGMEIVPGHSPVENDRFAGFHVGVDFETFPEEQDRDVDIFAVCDGLLVLKGFAKGYGGVAVQECTVEGELITIIYGHLRESSISTGFTQMMYAGQRVGVLGTGHSPETDGVRKHLHLGMRLGSSEDIRGYVKDPVEMEQWRNILNYISA